MFPYKGRVNHSITKSEKWNKKKQNEKMIEEIVFFSPFMLVFVICLFYICNIVTPKLRLVNSISVIDKPLYVCVIFGV